MIGLDPVAPKERKKEPGLQGWYRRRVRNLTYPQIVALGYFLLIMLGTALLMLPFATRAAGSIGFTKALFTATSATCVTGLVVGDTFLTFTMFGQIVLLLLIQVGGLGFLTILAMFSMFLKKRIGLRTRTLLKESVNSLYVGGIVRLFHKILIGTALFEGVGALLLATRFIPRYGFSEGLWFSVFHSVSAFCNAGFDLMGARSGPYSSLVSWADDPVVCITIAALIIVGGIGFFVWDDLQKNRLNWKRYALQTKIVLLMTALLLVAGTGVFLFLENGNTLAGMPWWQKLLDAWFCSVTPRTAGFNVVDTAAMTGAGRLMTVLLMFIGGSSGGTAGGVKTTTLAVILISSWNSLRSQKDSNIFGRRLESDSLRRANAVCTINLGCVLVATLAICALEPQLGLQDVLFEAVSAIGTVGLSVGAAGASHSAARIVLVLLMYMGRVGSLSFALLFAENKTPSDVRCPEERVSIG